MNVISEAERARIEKEAHEILESFSAALANVKVKTAKKSGKAVARGFREEGTGEKGDAAFREAMLANAPQHDEDAVIAEKKQW